MFILVLALAGITTPCHADERAPQPVPVPVIHFTDLYHPHNDPDDHWDLATLFALAHRESIDLKLAVIDYPRPDQPGDPALLAVSQLNSLTGLSVPCVVGSATGSDEEEPPPPSARSFLRAVKETLEGSPVPVCINVTGSCRDIAILGRAYPDLLREKVRAVYLNAGTGTTDPSKGANLEYNTRLAVADYAAVFELPCPVYWLPCFETLAGGGFQVEEYGSYWVFKQGEILPALSPGLQNFFLYALQRSSDPAWLRFLGNLPDAALLEKHGAQNRNMWCTAGFLHSAGLLVDSEGEILPIRSPQETPLYEFQPIAVQVEETGVKSWAPTSRETNRFILRILDQERYAESMTRALRDLLAGLR